jgi:hypothetical protein
MRQSVGLERERKQWEDLNRSKRLRKDEKGKARRLSPVGRRFGAL